jgi:hypothetical protein
MSQLTRAASWTTPSIVDDSHVAVGPKRLVALFRPASSEEHDAELQYGLNTAQESMYSSDARVTVHLVRPESVCGDGWLDDWAEECDPGVGETANLCDPETCTLEACDGETKVYYLDDDEDGFGDGEDDDNDGATDCEDESCKGKDGCPE